MRQLESITNPLKKVVKTNFKPIVKATRFFETESPIEDDIPQP